jgi:hypothetical protein
MKTKVIILVRLCFILGLMMSINSSNAKEIEAETLLNRNADEIYEFIVQTQYMHELCLILLPSNGTELNQEYVDSEISMFDELIPKSQNRFIQMIDTSLKKNSFLELLSKEKKDVLVENCKTKLPSQLMKIKKNVDELYIKVKADYDTFLESDIKKN